jgi:hypothetical protein
VHTGELLVRRFPRRDDFAAARAPAVGDRVHHVRPLGPLRMSWGRLMLGKPLARHECQRHG